MSSTVMFLGVALIFGGLVTVIAVIALSPRGDLGVNRSIAVLEALTSAPKEMTGEIDAPFADRVLLPLLARAQGLGRRLSPADANDRIHEKLELAGNPRGWTADRVSAGKVVGFFAAMGISLVLTIVMGLGFLPTLVVVVGASVAGYMAPNLYLYQQTFERAELLQRALPDAIDLLTISVESGLGFDAAVAQVARNTDGPLAEEFARMLQEMQIAPTCPIYAPSSARWSRPIRSVSRSLRCFECSPRRSESRSVSGPKKWLRRCRSRS
jgi:tight adherence protein C